MAGNQVRCVDCVHFIRDKVGFGDGIGNCAEFDAYLLKKPGADAIEIARQKLGSRSLYPNAVRNCQKFKNNNEE